MQVEWCGEGFLPRWPSFALDTSRTLDHPLYNFADFDFPRITGVRHHPIGPIQQRLGIKECITNLAGSGMLLRRKLFADSRVSENRTASFDARLFSDVALFCAKFIKSTLRGINQPRIKGLFNAFIAYVKPLAVSRENVAALYDTSSAIGTRSARLYRSALASLIAFFLDANQSERGKSKPSFLECVNYHFASNVTFVLG
jgi:hypothetical protein